MPIPTRPIARTSLHLAMTLAFLLSLPALPAQAAQPTTLQPCRKINNLNLCGPFLQQWSNQGSDSANIYVNGLPITERRPEISLADGKTCDTQWFERARYEAHPQNQPPYDVQLGLLGSYLAEGRPSTDLSGQPFLGIDRPPDADGKAKLWFPQTRHTLSGKFLQTWTRYGGLDQFGFPLSEPFEEVSATNGISYTVQYFERNRFELHPDNPAPYDVQLGLLGVEQYRLQPLPADQLPITPPKGVTSAKDTFVQGSLQEPDTLMGIEASTVVARRFTYAITFNDSLIGTDHLGNYFPLAAWYVPTIENGGSYFVGTGEERHLVTKYKLRRGLKWSDGVELTSNDAVFSYKLILDDPLTQDRSLQLKVSNVSNPDKYTIIYNWLSLREIKMLDRDPRTNKQTFGFLQTYIKHNRPAADPNYLAIGTVHPQHILSKIPIDSIQQSDFGQAPVGYGPYKVQEWKQGDSMTLVQNEHYNLTDKPLLNTIVAKFNTDINAQVNSVISGKLDGIASEGFALPPEQTEQLRQSGAVVDILPANTWEHLDFWFGYEPFKDKRVRQAIAHAINRRQLLDTAFKGAGDLMNGPVPPTIYHSLENPNFAENFPDLAAKYKLPIYSYDPAMADKLLDEAGWIAPCGDPTKCIRERNGEKLAIRYGYQRNLTRQAIAALIYYDLRKVGIDTHEWTPPQHEFGVPSFLACDGYVWTGSFKMAQYSYTTTATSNFDAWEYVDIIADPPCNGNRQQYINEKVNKANQLFKTEVDRYKLAEQSAIIQVELMNDMAIIPLVQRANIEIYRNTLKNRKTTNSTTPQWWNITQWYFDQ